MSQVNDTSHKKTWRDALGDALRKNTPQHRRLLVTTAIVVLVIVVFGVIPGYIATQPKFMNRYTHFSAQYVSWSTSVHSKVPCQRCHVAPTWTAQAAYSLKMLGEFYLSSVDPSRQPKLFPVPTNAACRSCHVDLRTVSPSGDLNIPHRAHVDVLKLQCVRCHLYLVHEKNPEGSHNPRMATCLVCHDGRQAKNACSTCHTNKLLPLNHRNPDWVVIHPQMQSKIDCKACHQWTVHWCAQCHAQRPKSHTVDWRTTHAQAVKTHRNCEACHTGAFCIQCHGDVPQLNFNPALKLVE